MNRPQTNRRSFLKTSAVLLSAPLILPRRVWSAESAPSKRLTVGCIGMGKQMGSHLGNCLNRDDIEVLAVCDVDTTRREHAKKRVDTAYTAKAGADYKGCAAYNDFRAVIARQDIDIIIIATPDHWHAYIAIAAVRAGKDVYCEKPLTYNVHEAVELVKEVRKADRVFQVGSQQRSSKEFRIAAELVRNGVLGRVDSIHVSFGDPAKPYTLPAEAMEPGLDWDRWCGPGPLVAYNPSLSPRGIHNNYPDWRLTWEFGGGMITDWGAHHMDIAQWALDMDTSGPVAIENIKGELPAKGELYNTATAFHFEAVYATGTRMIVDSTFREGIEFIGDNGKKIFVKRDLIEFTPQELRSEQIKPEEIQLHLSKKYNHNLDFVDHLYDGGATAAPIEASHRTITIAHLANLGLRFGKSSIKWDPATEQTTDAEISAQLSRPMRAPYVI
jgi:predicted dehydrogenase